MEFQWGNLCTISKISFFFFLCIAATLRVQYARWMWLSSPDPPCCRSLVCKWIAVGHTFFLAVCRSQHFRSPVHAQQSGLQDYSCRLVMVSASFSCTCGWLAVCFAVSFPLRWHVVCFAVNLPLRLLVVCFAVNRPLRLLVVSATVNLPLQWLVVLLFFCLPLRWRAVCFAVNLPLRWLVLCSAINFPLQ